MGIEREIRNYLNNNLRDLGTKSRDIDLILYSYGFGSVLWPTLEDAAIEFNVGDSRGRRSERPRQIINNKFKSNTRLKDLPLLQNFADFLKMATLHTAKEINKYAFVNDLFEEKVNIVALLRLLNDLSVCEEYKAYTLDLNDLTRAAYDTEQNIIVAKNASVKALRRAFKKAKIIPGLLGISKLEYLMNEIELSQKEQEVLISLIKLNSDSWFYNYHGSDYYLFESRDNTLVNNLEKAKNVAEFERLGILAEVLVNSLNRRTPPKGRDYPPKDVIQKYLLSSKYTEVCDSVVKLRVEATELTDIEGAAIKYLSEVDVYDYPTISEYLVGKGFSKPLVDKSIFNSPLIHVDKSKGRYHYKYNLIGLCPPFDTSNRSEYEEYRQRLLHIAAAGTDVDTSVISRKEQHILAEYLFKGKEQEFCAICKKKFSIKSLVTAHKKKRSDCAENERTDPYIVMPLCVFGCDYLYEERLVYIEKGIVKTVENFEEHYFVELAFIKEVLGNNVDEKWCRGSDSYFPKPV